MDFLKHALEALPNVASSPLAYVGYVVTIIAWTLVVLRTRRFGKLGRMLKDVPEPDRKEVILHEMGVRLPQSVSPEEWLRSRRQTYMLIGFGILALVVLSIVGMAFWNGAQQAKLRAEIEHTSRELQEADATLKTLVLGLAEAKGRIAMVGYYNPRVAEVKELSERLDRLLTHYERSGVSGAFANADDLWLKVARATVENARGNFKRATQLINRDSLDAEAVDVKANVERVSAGYQVLGDGYYGEEQWREALPCYEHVLELRPKDLRAALNAANCLSFLDRDLEAKLRYDSLIADYRIRSGQAQLPDAALFGGALNNRGFLYGKQHKWAEAVADFSEAVAVLDKVVVGGQQNFIPYLAGVLNNRAYVFQQQRAADDAVADLNRAITLLEGHDPQGTREEYKCQLTRSYSGRGHAMEKRGQSAEAASDLKRATELVNELAAQRGHERMASDLVEMLNAPEEVAAAGHSESPRSSRESCFVCHSGSE